MQGVEIRAMARDRARASDGLRRQRTVSGLRLLDLLALALALALALNGLFPPPSSAKVSPVLGLTANR